MHKIGLASIALVTLTTACNQGPTEEDYDDVAAGVGALVASPEGEDGDVGSMKVALEASTGGALPEGLTVMASGDIHGARGGLSYDYGLTCADAEGQPTACGERTDSARLTVAWSGSVDWPRYDASISRTGDWTLRGLQSDTAQLDGEGSFDVATEFMALYRAETRSFQLAYDATYEGVLIRRSDYAVVGGTVTYDVHAERMRTTARRDVDAEFDMEAVLTFDGTGTAHLELDGSRSYDVDLRNGSVAQSEL